MKYCFFICHDYKVNGETKYFDGNLKVLYGLYVEILEFLQAYKIPYSYEYQIDSKFLDSLNNELYGFEKKERDLKKQKTD